MNWNECCIIYCVYERPCLSGGSSAKEGFSDKCDQLKNVILLIFKSV